jgi:hypothetical protein
MEEKDKWLYIYTQVCTKENPQVMEILPNIQKIRKFLGKDNSREKVREYFLIPHNKMTLDFMEKTKDFNEREDVHLLIPYDVTSILGKYLTTRVRDPFYDISIIPERIFGPETIKKAINSKAILDMPKEEDILLVHGGYIVDSIKEQDIKKYDYLYEKGKKKKRR